MSVSDASGLVIVVRVGAGVGVSLCGTVDCLLKLLSLVGRAVRGS